MIEIKIEPVALPAFFLERYWEEIEVWVQQRPRAGEDHHVVLKEAPFADVSPNIDVGPVLRRVKLTSRVFRRGPTIVCEIMAASEHDERMILQHCEKMIRRGVRPRQFTLEAPRAYVPFMPRILKPNGGLH